MANTTVKITFDDGDTREFAASDELEKLIKAGEMFSLTTIHPSSGDEIGAMQISKMYAGNPRSALGHMMMMKRNAEELLEEDPSADDMEVVIDVVTACIKLLSDEITSHDSGMVTGDEDRLLVNHSIDPTDCPAINDQCDYYAYELADAHTRETVNCICEHPDNSEQVEGNCTSLLCPLCTEGGTGDDDGCS